MVRRATIEDVNKLKELLMLLSKKNDPDVLELEWAFFKEDTWKWWFFEFFDPTVANRGLASFFVANENGSIVGFCYGFVPKWRIPTAIVGVAVSTDYRRRKIGQALLKEVVGWANSVRLRALVADVWSWNEPSLAFFETAGFREEKRWLENFRRQKREKVRLVKFLP